MKMQVTTKWTMAVILPFLLSVTSPILNAVTTLTPVKPSEAKKVTPAEYLFVQSASKAIVKMHNDQNEYTITLKGVPPFVTYFSERPNRNAGIMPTEDFLKLWTKKSPDSFRVDPPNAVLNALQIGIFASDKVFNFAVELKNPHYDKMAHTLTYTAIPTQGALAPLPEAITLHHVSLFIDDVCLSCW